MMAMGWMGFGWLGLAAAGGGLWTFAEYAIHRWEGHRRRRPHVGTRLHLQHHSEPSAFPASPTVAAWVALAVVPSAAAAWWLAGIVATGLPVGFALGYLVYEWLHYRIHVHPPRGAWGRWARHHHFAHHFRDPHGNFGVTTAVWDRLLGTDLGPGPVRVPRRHRPPWLPSGQRVIVAQASPES